MYDWGLGEKANRQQRHGPDSGSHKRYRNAETRLAMRRAGIGVAKSMLAFCLGTLRCRYDRRAPRNREGHRRRLASETCQRNGGPHIAKCITNDYSNATEEQAMGCGVGLIGRGIVFGGAMVIAMAGCSGSSTGSRPPAATTGGTTPMSVGDGGVATGNPTGTPGTTPGSNGNPGSQGTITGSNGAPGGQGAMTGSTGTGSSWTALTAPEIALIGGASLSAGGVAHAGGNLHLISSGGIDLDPAGTVPQVPVSPTPPAGAQAVTASMLAADATVAGAAVLAGVVQSGGMDRSAT